MFLFSSNQRLGQTYDALGELFLQQGPLQESFNSKFSCRNSSLKDFPYRQGLIFTIVNGDIVFDNNCCLLHTPTCTKHEISIGKNLSYVPHMATASRLSPWHHILKFTLEWEVQYRTIDRLWGRWVIQRFRINSNRDEQPCVDPSKTGISNRPFSEMGYLIDQCLSCGGVYLWTTARKYRSTCF